MPMPFEIVQTPKEVVIAYESFHAFRIIPINDKLQHPNDLVPTWMGDSVARWDGDTLVVDVTGFNDKTWLSGTGSFTAKICTWWSASSSTATTPSPTRPR
jgi:hypothetical protein